MFTPLFYYIFLIFCGQVIKLKPIYLFKNLIFSLILCYFPQQFLYFFPEPHSKTLTVQKLINCLSDFDPDAKIYFSNNNGYTYGNISEWDFNEKYGNEEDED